MTSGLKRQPRKMKDPLLKCEKHLLLTGDCVPPNGKHWRKDYGESWVRPFILVSPAGRDELRELWLTCRDELLQEWKRQGKRGKPWAQREFDKERKLQMQEGEVRR